MAFPGAGPGGNFLEQMLGDLMKLMGGPASGGARIDLARTLAQGVASEGEPEANPDPVERIRIEELVHVAELHVAELTGSSATPTGSSMEVAAVGPGAWAWQTVEDWRFLLDAMSSTATATTGPDTTPEGLDTAAPGTGAGADPPGLGLTDLGDDVDPAPGQGDVLGRWLATMGPVLSAVQLASAVGHLARTTLGPYEVPIPRPGQKLLIVPANVARFAEEWSLDPDEVRLWVCLRSVTTHTVLSKPHVSARVQELLVRVVEGMTEEASSLTDRFNDLDFTEPDALQRLLGDPDALLAVEASPARRRAADDLSAVAVALVGYVEHVLDGSASRLLGGRGAIAEAWRRRQVDREGPARSAEQMVGLDLAPAQTDRGAAFVRGVLERAGEEGLARLWSAASALPTPAEVDAPGLWLERIDLAGGEP